MVGLIMNESLIKANCESGVKFGLSHIDMIHSQLYKLYKWLFTGFPVFIHL